MSLLLKGREMPEECCGCPVEYDGCCRLLDYQDTPYDGRLDECPLVVFDTDDVAPVIHGHWIKDNDIDYGCSVCGRRQLWMNATVYEYCPHCGAKMDESERET